MGQKGAVFKDLQEKYSLCWFIPGHCAALNMLHRGKELHTVPYFWTTMLGKSIRYAGRKGQREGNRTASSQSAGSGACKHTVVAEFT